MRVEKGHRVHCVLRAGGGPRDGALWPRRVLWGLRAQAAVAGLPRTQVPSVPRPAHKYREGSCGHKNGIADPGAARVRGRAGSNCLNGSNSSS